MWTRSDPLGKGGSKKSLKAANVLTLSFRITMPMDCLPPSGAHFCVTSCFLPVCLAPQEVRKAWTKEALLPNDQTQIVRPGQRRRGWPNNSHSTVHSHLEK